MARLLLTRAAWALVTLFGVTFLTFVVVFLIPADPATLLAGKSADPQVIAAIRRQHKLDQPLLVRYADMVWRLAHGDLGRSYVRDAPVAEIIAARLPLTVELAVAGWCCWLGIGTALGVWAASRRSGAWDNGLLLLSILGVSTPTFWVGILLLYVFVSRLHLFPAGGSGTPQQLVLPVAALAFSGIAYYARLAHSSMRDTLRADFVRTAVGKGVSPGRVVWVHALRNALLPLVTLAGADLASLLGGVVFTESVFDWKGMGLLAVEAVSTVDIPVIVGVVLVSAVFVVVANLIVDLLYPLLDPRVRRPDAS